jgi:ParB-like chromosome segregation protein Spo0J
VGHEALAKSFTPKVQMHRIAGLKPNPRNARTLGKKQIRQLAADIKAIGFIVPIIIDETGSILAGHGRLAAAALNGLTEVPTIRVSARRRS